jgi:D-alanine transaminase
MRVHLNGLLVSRDEARIDPFDRGFIFGDGVYEGLRAFRGRVRAIDRHVKRLRESLHAASIDFDAARLGPLSDELLRANGLTDAFLYWQFTRGTPGPGQPVRARVPDGSMVPTVFGYAMERPPLERCTEPGTTTAALVEDLRWHRGRVKAISLLGNVMAAMEARECGAEDAIFVRGGLAGEATATNIFVVLPDGRGGSQIVTPSLESVSILAGVTRDLLLERMSEIVERPVRAEELARASEILLCGTNTMIASVLTLDGRPVGDGKVGPVARRLARTLVEVVGAELASPAMTGAV